MIRKSLPPDLIRGGYGFRQSMPSGSTRGIMLGVGGSLPSGTAGSGSSRDDTAESQAIRAGYAPRLHASRLTSLERASQRQVGLEPYAIHPIPCSRTSVSHTGNARARMTEAYRGRGFSHNLTEDPKHAIDEFLVHFTGHLAERGERFEKVALLCN